MDTFAAIIAIIAIIIATIGIIIAIIVATIIITVVIMVAVKVKCTGGTGVTRRTTWTLSNFSPNRDARADCEYKLVLLM